MSGPRFRRPNTDTLSAADLVNVTKCFSEWGAYDGGRSLTAERAALVAIRKQMLDTLECLSAVFSGGPDMVDDTPLKSAWRKVGAMMQATGATHLRPLQAGLDVTAALASWAEGARAAHQAMPATRFRRSAAHMAAATLWALRDARKFKRSTHIDGQAVTELVSAANKAKVHLTRDAAQKVLKATNAK